MLRRSRLAGVVALVAPTALVATAAAFGARAETVKLSAKMDSGQVVPHKPKGNVVGAAGTFAGTLTSSGWRWTLAWRIAYKGLDHPSIVIADIHYGKRGRFGPVIVRLSGPCKADGQRGVVKVKASWIPSVKSGSTFVTLITGKNPNGQIRGQIETR